MAKTFGPYYLLTGVWLVSVFAIGATQPDAGDEKPFECADLDFENSIDQQTGKWKSYEFVLDDCLLKRFIAQCGPRVGNGNIDIYSSLKELEEIISENLKLERAKLDRVEEEAKRLVGSNKMKHDLEVSSAARRSKRHRLALDRLLEEARVRVSLAGNEISAALEERVRSMKMGNSHQADKDICSSEGLPVDLVAQARQLCRQLDAQVALQQLARKLDQRQQLAGRVGPELGSPAA